MRPRKASDETIEDIRAWETLKRSIPTREQMAKKHGLSLTTIDRIAKGYKYRLFLEESEIDELCGQVSQN